MELNCRWVDNWWRVSLIIWGISLLVSKEIRKSCFFLFLEFCKFMKKEVRIFCNLVIFLYILKGDDKEDCGRNGNVNKI